MVAKRIQVFIPDNLLKEIDQMFGKRKRSVFITQAIQKDLQRVKLLKTLKETTGTWKEEEHPELAEGTDRWVEKLRLEMEGRMEVFDEHKRVSPGYIRHD